MSVLTSVLPRKTALAAACEPSFYEYRCLNGRTRQRRLCRFCDFKPKACGSWVTIGSCPV